MNHRADKIIFLDMDGVLCTFRAYCGQGSPDGLMSSLDREGVGMLNDLAEHGDGGVRYVLSSTWRKAGERGNVEWMTKHLRSFGWRGQFHEDWRTVDLGGEPRGAEIAEWLSRHPEVQTYLILDDDGDMLKSQRDNFVQTHCHDGISFENYLQASLVLHGTRTPWVEDRSAARKIGTGS